MTKPEIAGQSKISNSNNQYVLLLIKKFLTHMTRFAFFFINS